MSNLLVQNIKHTNGTVAQTIDSSGRVLTPARPSFCAYEDSGGHQIDATSTIRYQTTTCNVTIIHKHL